MRWLTGSATLREVLTLQSGNSHIYRYENTYISVLKSLSRCFSFSLFSFRLFVTAASGQLISVYTHRQKHTYTFFGVVSYLFIFTQSSSRGLVLCSNGLFYILLFLLLLSWIYTIKISMYVWWYLLERQKKSTIYIWQYGTTEGKNSIGSSAQHCAHAYSN